MKRALFGAMWFVVLTIAGIWIGGIAAAISGAKDSSAGYEESQASGQAAVRKFGAEYGGYIALGALIFSIIGTCAGALPGTRPRNGSDEEPG